jgi:hypothetical protein
VSVVINKVISQFSYHNFFCVFSMQIWQDYIHIYTHSLFLSHLLLFLIPFLSSDRRPFRSDSNGLT